MKERDDYRKKKFFINNPVEQLCMTVLRKLLNKFGRIFGASSTGLLDFVRKMQKYTSLAYS